MDSDRYYIGVDVGTRSVRAGLFDGSGELLGSATREIALYLAPGGIAEQSSEEIWTAVCDCVARAAGAVPSGAKRVVGIGFDATCSLVVVDAAGAPLPVGDPATQQRNIVVWMDHRATAEADAINRSGHRVLDYVGGSVSPEMQTPKLLWLKQHRPETFSNAAHFFDLSDYLSWRATGSATRSTCTLTCKWTYLAHERGWAADYFETIGMAELAKDNFARIGQRAAEPGTAIGRLTPQAATLMGLSADTVVGAGLIDAHAGGIGTVGAADGPGSVTSRLAYVFGTSACTMASTTEPVFVKGVWGPYYSAMVPGLWLAEGGQSAAGAALDQLVLHHPAADEAAAAAGRENLSLVQWLANRASGGLKDMSRAIDRIGDIHVVPEFLGNRAPFADPHARALIAGLGMEADTESLVGLYLAGLCSLGYGLRQILDAMAEKGIAIDTIVVSGGAARSPLVRQLLADSTGTKVAGTAGEEPVLLGSAMVGAVAAGAYPDLNAAMMLMSRVTTVYEPSRDTGTWHSNRYLAFRTLQSAGRTVRELSQA